MSLHHQHILRQFSDKTISTEGQSQPLSDLRFSFQAFTSMKYSKTDLPDHLKLYIKIMLLQYAHTGNVRQKGAGFECFRERLKHLGCCAILWQILLLPLQPEKVFSLVEVEQVCHSSGAWLQHCQH